jgi:hypothetical protein
VIFTVEIIHYNYLQELRQKKTKIIGKSLLIKISVEPPMHIQKKGIIQAGMEFVWLLLQFSYQQILHLLFFFKLLTMHRGDAFEAEFSILIGLVGQKISLEFVEFYPNLSTVIK